jgi:hypothetical protein
MPVLPLTALTKPRVPSTPFVRINPSSLPRSIACWDGPGTPGTSRRSGSSSWMPRAEGRPDGPLSATSRAPSGRATFCACSSGSEKRGGCAKIQKNPYRKWKFEKKKRSPAFWSFGSRFASALVWRFGPMFAGVGSDAGSFLPRVAGSPSVGSRFRCVSMPGYSSRERRFLPLTDRSSATPPPPPPLGCCRRAPQRPPIVVWVELVRGAKNIPADRLGVGARGPVEGRPIRCSCRSFVRLHFLIVSMIHLFPPWIKRGRDGG